MAVVLALGPTLGCFDPTPPEIGCSDSGGCPMGQSCDPVDNTCRATPTSIPPIDTDETTLLEQGTGLFDVAPIRGNGFVIATGDTEVRFYRIEPDGEILGPLTNPSITIEGEIDFLSVEPLSGDTFVLTTHDQGGIHIWNVEAANYTVTLEVNLSSDMSPIETSAIDLGPDTLPHYAVIYYAEGQLRYRDNEGTTKEIVAAVPAYAALLYRVEPVLLFEQAMATYYWLLRPFTPKVAILPTVEYATLSLGGGPSLDLALGVEPDSTSTLYLLHVNESAASFGPGTNLAIQLDVGSRPEVVEGPQTVLPATELRIEAGISYRYQTAEHGDLYLVRESLHTGDGDPYWEPMVSEPMLITTADDHDVGNRHRLAYNADRNRYLLAWEDTRAGQAGIYLRTVGAF